MPDSEQLRVFLAIIRTGNTVAAARKLGIDHSTISRRLATLEQVLGVRLFDRSPRGLAPTEAAGGLISHAEAIERELLAATQSVADRNGAVRGIVRLATPEIFGTWLVAPRIAELRTRHPDLTLELAPESRLISLSKREADIAITVRRPPRGRLIVRKLADYHIGLYGARDYLATHRPINTAAALAEYSFVSYIDELLDYPEMNALQSAMPEAVPVFRSSSSAAQQAAVAAGTGLGMLHRLTADQDPRLVRVLPDSIEVARSYWLVMHADQQHNSRNRAIIDFLGGVVDQMRGKL